ncbi:MAG: hypothetical protein ACR2JR_15065 [Rubrobacteraceae bacterium]
MSKSLPETITVDGARLELVLERVLERAEQVRDRRHARAAVLEGYLDAMLRYRKSLLLLVRDVSAGPQEFYDRTIRLTARAIGLVAGPGADLDERVRATQALSALGDPLIMFPETPDGELRGRMLDGAWRLLEGPTERRPEP